MKKLLRASALVAIGAGVILLAGGLWAAVFTYQTVAREKIVTPSDASLPNTPVRGPFTLLSQADIIRTHTLHATGGKTYAEMPMQATNDPRAIWVTATTLITALHLGVITYLFSALMMLLGAISVWTGVVFAALSKHF